MLSGQRAFHRDSAAETMSAILREEPPDLSATNKSVQPGLERIVRHCLEKNPEERFYSARDVAFDLEALSGLSAPQVAATAAHGAAKRPAWMLVAASVVATAAVCAALGLVAVRKAGERPPPSFRQLTYRRGQVFSARFAPDGQTIMYSAAWDDRPMEVFVGRPESPESRPFGLVGAAVLSISKSGDMAVSLNRVVIDAFRGTGTLAQLSVAGGAAPRDILKEVEWADWGPDGRSIGDRARSLPGKMRIEYPIGKVALRDERLGQPSAGLARREARRVHRPPDAGRRQRLGRRRGPGRKEEGPHGAVRHGAGSGVVVERARSGSRRPSSAAIARSG